MPQINILTLQLFKEALWLLLRICLLELKIYKLASFLTKSILSLVWESCMTQLIGEKVRSLLRDLRSCETEMRLKENLGT